MSCSKSDGVTRSINVSSLHCPSYFFPKAKKEAFWSFYIAQCLRHFTFFFYLLLNFLHEFTHIKERSCPSICLSQSVGHAVAKKNNKKHLSYRYFRHSSCLFVLIHSFIHSVIHSFIHSFILLSQQAESHKKMDVMKIFFLRNLALYNNIEACF